MGSYYIPRNTKGEGRLFYIFSYKALAYTVIGIVIGWVLKWILGIFGKIIPGTSSVFNIIGIIFIIVLALLGFAIGTFKVPQIDRFEITKKASGINIDKVLIGSLKFHFKKDKYYVYDTDELLKEEIKKKIQEEAENKAKIEKERKENKR